MFRDDYIMRLVRQLIQVLHRVRNLLAGGQAHAALDAIERAVRELLDVAPDDADFTLGNIYRNLRVDPLTPANRDQRLALATLLHEAGNVYMAQQRVDDAYRCRSQALDLLLDALRDDPHAFMPSYVPTIHELDTALRGYDLPPALYQRLLQAYEGSGAYDHAEDVLYVWRAAWPDDEQVQQAGQWFYERLDRRDDAELAAGNLPRDELDAGRTAWLDTRS